MRIRPQYRIKNPPLLVRILWADFLLGASSGLIGLIFYLILAPIFGLPEKVLIWISSITLIYAFFVFRLARQTEVSIPFLRILILANLIWTMISLGIISIYFNEASQLGKLFLILQIIVVGCLAWLEGNQLEKKKAST